MNFTPEHWARLTTFSPVAALLVGVLLLFLGRKLFWLFVAAIGFIVGAEIAAAAFPHQPGWELIGGLILGVVGALFAILVQKIAIGVGGFLAGGYFLMAALRAYETQSPQTQWISFLIGGIIGAVLMIFVFDWALIVFSSISGAHLITHAFFLNSSLAAVAFAVLFLIGVLVQARRLASPRRIEA
jgi:hypothetical protein